MLVGGVVTALLLRGGDDATDRTASTGAVAPIETAAAVAPIETAAAVAPIDTTAAEEPSATSARTETTAADESSATSAPTAPTAAGSVDCQPLDGLAVRFCDGFEGASLDPTKWVESANGGTVTVADGEVAVSSTGRAIPVRHQRDQPVP